MIEMLGPLQAAGDEAVARLQTTRAVERLWRREGTLWSTEPTVVRAIEDRLGWLNVAETSGRYIGEIEHRLGAVGPSPRRVVLLGMGGSSLAPEVMTRTLPGAVRPLHVLDSTAPAEIRAVEEGGLDGTVFVVSSKSGTTTETRTLAAYFLEHAAGIPGAGFVAVTDPETPLDRQAAAPPFRAAFLNPADIGGRYSALSFFGLVPAALCGLDVRRLLDRTVPMVQACREARGAENPGARLGAILGAAALAGRNKVTLYPSRTLAGLGAWVEQLLAESTGKQGRGLLPVDGEPLAGPEAYGPDRLFVSVALDGEAEDDSTALERLARAGHPVVRITVASRGDLGAEFFRWEVATALAGFLMAINPFDEPNVQQSKDVTNALLATFRREGRLPGEDPAVTTGGVSLFGPVAGKDVGEALAAFLQPARPPQYVGLLAYLPRRAAVEESLGLMRQVLRDRLRVATTRGYGPRYLHSTGQLFKGGPSGGRFLVFTADADIDVTIPGEPYSFGTLLRAQALGDVQALRERGQAVLRVHLHGSEAGLAEVARWLSAALSA